MDLLTRIKISDFTYLFLLFSLIAGYFSFVFILLFIILIHELGHLLVASFMNFKIDKIILYPFGGIIKFDNLLNTNVYKELLVAIGGPLVQIIFYYFVYILYKYGFVSTYIFETIKVINFALLSFNLLPIIPLDGAKILNLILEKFFSYKLSNTIIIILSLIAVVFICFYSKKIFFIVLILLLLRSIYSEIKIFKYKFNKFLLERYIYNIKFKKYKVINRIEKISKDKYHIININNKYETEKEYLRKMFD